MTDVALTTQRTRRAFDVISEACFTSDLRASHVGPPHVRSRSDTVMISMNYNSYATLAIFFIIPVLFYFVFELELYILYECQLCLIFITIRKLAIKLSVKTFKTWTVHFIFTLRIFVSAHVVITSITAPSMFINLCLVVLLLLPGSLVSKFHFQLTKKT